MLNNDILPEPNNKLSIKFLKQWAAKGPWVLVAIHVDKKSRLEAQTFYPDKVEVLEAWLAKFNGKRNIYFHVNPTQTAMSSKAKKEDVKSVDWLHVDIDPVARQPLEQERERISGVLTERLPKGVPEPTVIIFSGGGYQAFWKLRDPIDISGDLDKAKDAERYNKELERLFGADSCHNVDRIMRLAGTVNIPDDKKIKKGRKAELAKVINFEDKNIYPLSAFKQYQAEKGAVIQSDFEQDDSIEIPKDIDGLDQWGVSKKLKELIVHGRYLNNSDKYPSRSEALFAVVCEMYRQNVPDVVIQWAIICPEFKISESVLENSDYVSYAQRQVKRAKELVLANPDITQEVVEVLEKMNRRFFVVGSEGGKCLVAYFEKQPLGGGQFRDVLVFQAFGDLKNRFINVQVVAGYTKSDKPIIKPLGKYWLEHPNRRQYDRIVFMPGEDVLENEYNLWRGFGVQVKKDSWKKMQRHIWRVLARRDSAAFRYIMQWCAWAVQNPNERAEVALVFKGGKGTGKGTFCNAIVSLFGHHGLTVSSSQHITGRFNRHLRDCVLLFADEAIAPNDRQAESVIKALITEPRIAIEGKGVDIFQSPNYLHILMASNADWVVPASADERRYAVFDVSGDVAQSDGWFGPLNKEVNNGGLEAMLYFFSNLDLKDWHPRKNIPANQALNDQRIESLRGLDSLWLDCLAMGEVVGEPYNAGVLIPTRIFAAQAKVKAKAAGEYLKKMGCTPERTTQYRAWCAPPLAEARRIWDQVFFPIDWDDTDAWIPSQPDETPF